MKKEKIIIIAGPTGVGKTSASIEMAKKINGEIISADSMQIYKFMDIGTAKITEKEKENIPHHAIDFLSPFESFTVADYAKMAREKITEITSRGKTPIVVGGTGLYINSLIYSMDFNEADVDAEFREYLWDYYYKHGEDNLFELLLAKTGDQEINIEKRNIKRVIRALEIIASTGGFKGFKEVQEKTGYDYKLYVLYRDRETLYNNINKRVDIMFENGLLDEVRKLADSGLNESYQSMKGIGYRQVLDYFDGKYTLDEASEKIKQESRRYAKRQLTWFRRYKEAIWIKALD